MELLPQNAQRGLNFGLSLTRNASDPAKKPPTLAIDFGDKGGLVFNLNGDLYMVDMPETLPEIISVIRQSSAETAFGEDVHAFPGQGVTSVATFMRGAGRIDGVLATLNIPLTEIPPQTWTRWYDIGKSSDFKRPNGDTDITRWKKHLKAYAEQLFPDYEVSKNCADALLIWNYATQILKAPSFSR